jgi:hypothetical protein
MVKSAIGYPRTHIVAVAGVLCNPGRASAAEGAFARASGGNRSGRIGGDSRLAAAGAMRLRRDRPKRRTAAEPAAARIGLKPPGRGRLKWVRVGFAWDLFVLSPLLGLPLFWRKLHAWGAVTLGLWLLWLALGALLEGRLKWIAGMAVAAAFFLLDLFLGFYGNRLTARAYLRHGWTVDHPDYAATRKVVARWKLEI